MNEFKIPSSSILMILAMRHAFWPALLILILFFASIAVGIFVDYRWIAMAFILLCLVLPMIAAFLYFWYALKPATAFNTLPHTLSLTQDALIVRMRVIPPVEEEDAPHDEGLQEESGDDQAPEDEFREVSFPINRISSFELWTGGYILNIGEKGSDGFLIVPASSLPENDLSHLLESI